LPAAQTHPSNTGAAARALPGGGPRIKNRYDNRSAIDVDQFALMPAAYRSHRL